METRPFLGGFFNSLKFNDQSDGRKDSSRRIHDGFELVAAWVCRVYCQVALSISDWDYLWWLLSLKVVSVLDVKVPVEAPAVKEVLFIKAKVQLVKGL